MKRTLLLEQEICDTIVECLADEHEISVEDLKDGMFDDGEDMQAARVWATRLDVALHELRNQLKTEG